MNELGIIRKGELDGALKKKYRLYLAGRLTLPQDELECIDDDIEIGISEYKAFTADAPHMHPIATEHGYVLSGCLRVRLLNESHDEFEFSEGDFFVLKPGVPYATKNREGTRILFIKSPGGNDKTTVPIDSETQSWLSEWDT